MSYEGKMLEQFAMPTQSEVEQALLRALLKHGGVIKEFGSGQEIVDEIANDFGLNENQRSAFLETIYRKENRVKKSLLRLIMSKNAARAFGVLFRVMNSFTPQS
jgi:hypothetical protein